MTQDLAVPNSNSGTQMDLFEGVTPLTPLAGVTTFGPGSYLPTIQIVQGLSPELGSPLNFPIGSFFLRRGKDRELLGTSFEGGFVEQRWHAIGYFAEGDKTVVRRSFDHESAEFQELKDLADRGVKDASGRPVARWGWDFLTYLSDLGKYVVFPCNSPSLRYSAQESFMDNLRKPLTVYSDLTELKNKKFYAPKVRRSNIEWAIRPIVAEMNAEIEKFLKGVDTQEAEESTVDPSVSAGIDNL